MTIDIDFLNPDSFIVVNNKKKHEHGQADVHFHDQAGLTGL